MSAIPIKNNGSDPVNQIIWSRGGGSFGRLVWKELNEAGGLWAVIALVTLCLALLIDRKEIWSVPALWLHAAPALFALLYGSRAFVREVSGGTWELLRSVGASAFKVVASKWLVGALGSFLLMWMSIGLAVVRQLPLHIADPGEPTVWYLLVVLVSLGISLVVSQWSRAAWAAIVLAGMLCLSLWTLWAIGFHDLYLWTQQFRWECNGMIFLAIATLPALFATQVWNARWSLFDGSGISGSQRWRQIFWRMAWKELLASRDFWLAVLGIVLLLDGLAWWVFRDVQTREATIVVIGVFLPLLHALGCGAISFAIEREDGTHDWLRRMSAPADSVFAGKLAVSQASILTLTGLVILVTQCLVGTNDRMNGLQVFALLLVVMLTGITSLGASMLTRRVLPAVFLAFLSVAGVAIVSSSLVAAAIEFSHRGSKNPVGPERLLPWGSLVGTLLLSVDFLLADRWLNERPWWKQVWRGDLTKKAKRQRDVAWFEQLPSSEMRAFGRLLWREWREARVWLWIMPIALAPWLMQEASEYYQSLARQGKSFNLAMIGTIPLLAILSIMLTVLPTLWGVWGMHHDQRQGLFRFLSDRGGSPTGIWFSKHAVWLPQVLLLALITGITFGLDFFRHREQDFFICVGFALVGALQGYAAGQWLAQLIRSPLNSLFLASVLSLLLAGWSRLLWDVQAPWVYQLVPAVTLLFASWVHARDWLEERTSPRAWLKVAAAVLIPATELVLILEVQGYPLWATLRDWPMFR
jgi:ABC-type transport system involved in multi-copper enzyme maturation permease subunit